ncbi:MAG: immunoglobulin-like domain-containing protein [Mycoplasmatales bacterium]
MNRKWLSKACNLTLLFLLFFSTFWKLTPLIAAQISESQLTAKAATSETTAVNLKYDDLKNPKIFGTSGQVTQADTSLIGMEKQKQGAFYSFPDFDMTQNFSLTFDMEITPPPKIPGNSPLDSLYYCDGGNGNLSNCRAADSFSVVFTDSGTRSELGSPGNGYGMDGLKNVRGIVYDYYEGILRSCETDNQGKKTCSNFSPDADKQGLKFFVNDQNNTDGWVAPPAKTVKYKINFDAAINSITGSVAVDGTEYVIKDKNANESLQNWIDQSKGYPIKIGASSGSGTSNVQITDFSFNGFIRGSSNLNFQTTPTPVVGTAFNGELAITNPFQAVDIEATVNIPLPDATYVTGSNSFTLKHGDGSTEVINQSIYTKDLKIPILQGETVTLIYPITVKDPASLTKAEQTTLMNQTTANIYSGFTQNSLVTFASLGDFEYPSSDTVSFALATGSITADSNYQVPSTIDLSNQKAVEDYLKGQIQISDPALTKITSSELISSARTTFSDYSFASATKTATITVNYDSLNGAVVQKIITLQNGVASIVAGDATIKEAEAPTTATQIKQLLHPTAIDNDGFFVEQADISITNDDGYDSTKPLAKPSYNITFEFTDNQGNKLTTTAKLNIVADTGNKYDAVIKGSNPIEVPVGTSLADVKKKINAYVAGSKDGVLESIDDSTIKYLNEGTYQPVLGIYALEVNGTYQGLTAKEIFLVNVTPAPDTVNHAEITANDVGIALGGTFDPMTTPNVAATSKADGDITNKVTIVQNTVDVNTVGMYKVAYEAIDSTGAKAFKVIKVKVIDSLARVIASDAEVELASAPKTEKDVLKLLHPQAVDIDGTDITDKVTIKDYDGYNLEAPAVGDYEITLAVTDSSIIDRQGVQITTKVKLHVVADNTTNNEYTAFVRGNTPIHVPIGTSISDVQNLISPYVEGQIDGVADSINSDSSAKLKVMNPTDYNGATEGTYYIGISGEYKPTDGANTLIARGGFTVIVDAAGTTPSSEVTITANDVTIAKNSTFDELKTPKVKALSTTDNDITQTRTKVTFNDVDMKTAGKYQVAYEAVDSTGAVGVKIVTITVSDSSAKIVASDAKVKLSQAPTTDAKLLQLLHPSAVETDGTNISSKVVIDDLGTYDYSAPKVGSYEIQVGVLDKNNVQLTTTATLEIVDDSGNNKYTAQIKGNNPIEVQSGTTVQDVKKKIAAYVVGYKDDVIDKIDSSTINFVNEADYQSTKGQYLLEANGTYNGLTAKEIFTVNVVDTLNTTDNVVITANDVNLKTGTEFKEIETPNVVATSKKDGVITNKVTVLLNNVDTAVAGTYQVVYEVTDSVGVYATKIITVKVSDSAANIVASDAKVKLNNAPKNQADLFKLIQPIALEGDGTNISDKVTVSNLNLYDYTNPKIGKYKIEVKVVDANGVEITTTANLDVVANLGNDNYTAQIIGNNPIEVSTGTSIADVKTKIDAYLYGSKNNTLEIVDNKGITYPNEASYTGVAGQYILEANGTYNGLTIKQLFVVNVTATAGSTDSVMISANDVKLKVGANFDPIITPNVVATSTTDNDITKKVSQTFNNVQTTVAGSYQVAYKVIDSKGAIATKVIAVEVVDTTANLVASDAKVKLSSAPIDQIGLFKLIHPSAVDIDGTVITDKVTVSDLGGYDYASPKIGKYQIELKVLDGNKTLLTTKANLEIVANASNDDYTAVVKGNNPIEVVVGTSISDVKKKIAAYIEGQKNGQVDTIDSSTIKFVNEATYQAVKGKYSLEVNGTYNGLTAKEIFTVNVVDTANSTDSAQIIANNVLLGQNATFDPLVTPKVSATSQADGTITNLVKVSYNNVDTTKVGIYKVVYEVTDSKGAYATKIIRVEVVTSRAKIIGSDAEVKLIKAPTTDQALLKLLHPEAIDIDGTDITSKVTIANYGGYDFTNPQVGDYKIQLAVEDSSIIDMFGAQLTTTATLHVVADTAKNDVYTAYIRGNTPVHVPVGTSLADVQKLIAPYVEGQVNDQIDKIDNTSTANLKIINPSAYDENTPATYFLGISGEYQPADGSNKLVAKSGFEVIVDDKTTTPIPTSEVTIKANDLTLPLNGTFDELKTPNVTATSTADGDVLNKVTVTYSNVDMKKTGTYQVAYQAIDTTGAIGTKLITIKVKETKAKIVASDAKVKLSDAPTTKAGLLTLIHPQATDNDLLDISSKIVVKDLGGYDYTSPKVGDYEITVKVVDQNGVELTTTATLSVVDDKNNNNYQAQINGNNPIEVLVGTPIEEVEKTIEAYVYGFENEKLVSLDNSSITYVNEQEYQPVKGQYILEANGTYQPSTKIRAKNSLTTKQLFTINVVDKLDTTNNVKLTANNVSVVRGSLFNPMSMPEVEAISQKDGDITKQVQIVFNDVDMQTVGTYKVAYTVTDSTGAIATKVITVTIVDETDKVNPTLVAKDTSITINKAPMTIDSLKEVMKVQAKSNGVDITADVTIYDFGNYDVTNPQVGNYQIIYIVSDSNGVIVTRTNTLIVSKKPAIDVDKPTKPGKPDKPLSTGTIIFSFIGVVAAVIVVILYFVRKKIN